MSRFRTKDSSNFFLSKRFSAEVVNDFASQGNEREFEASSMRSAFEETSCECTPTVKMMTSLMMQCMSLSLHSQKRLICFKCSFD